MSALLRESRLAADPFYIIILFQEPEPLGHGFFAAVFLLQRPFSECSSWCKRKEKCFNLSLSRHVCVSRILLKNKAHAHKVIEMNVTHTHIPQ